MDKEELEIMEIIVSAELERDVWADIEARWALEDSNK